MVFAPLFQLSTVEHILRRYWNPAGLQLASAQDDDYSQHVLMQLEYKKSKTRINLSIKLRRPLNYTSQDAEYRSTLLSFQLRPLH